MLQMKERMPVTDRKYRYILKRADISAVYADILRKHAEILFVHADIRQASSCSNVPLEYHYTTNL
ncbi:hypothetical protein CV093_01305 [Oceanobacillus sp. 143]|nr:hypothetical protein CV093_01305 [Oceanobacillus sp. 143]